MSHVKCCLTRYEAYCSNLLSLLSNISSLRHTCIKSQSTSNMSGFGQTEPSTIDLTIINVSAESGKDNFVTLQNAIVAGPPRVLLDRVASHLKTGCYKVISLSIGGPQGDHRATCVAVIASTLSNTELRRRGFEWHDLSPADTTAPTTTSNTSPLLQHEMDSVEEQVKSDTSTELVRMDFVNGHWRSSYNIIRGGFHNTSIERALILLDDAINAGCFKLEALWAVRDWCTVTIDTDLTKEELRAKGFRWHGLETGDVPDEDGCIVIPGWSRADDGWEDENGDWVSEQQEWRDL